MKNKSTYLILAYALSLGAVNTASAVYDAKKATAEKPTHFAQYPHDDKPMLMAQKGDITAILGGKTKIEGYWAKNAVLLNSDLPDEYGFFRQLSDVYLDIRYGQGKWGHPALEWFVDFRQRSLWGDAGFYVQTDGNRDKIKDSVFGGHNHEIPRPLFWARDLWMQASLNAIFNHQGETTHYIKAGLFPYELGRGISLGYYYGTTKEFLGLYSYQNDQSAPGILIHGEIFKDYLAYEFYYSKLEEKTNTLSRTFNHDKAQHVGRKNRPWRGVSKDNDLVSASMKWRPFAHQNVDEFGTLILNPYVLWNDASDQTVEIQFDAKSELGTFGLAFEYEFKNIEIGGEVAWNFGQEKLREIDRNVIFVNRKSNGSLEEAYTKVFASNSETPGAPFAAPVTSDIKAIVDKNCHIQNDIPIGQALVDVKKEVQFLSGTVTTPVETTDNLVGCENHLLTNAPDRYRSSREIDYEGWMMTLDAEYKIPDADLRLAASFSYVTGDTDPHKTDTKTSFHGFVGLNENYAGTRVPSVIILDSRKLLRPLTTDRDTTFSQSDNSFTDMIVLGLGAIWTPELAGRRFMVNPNALFYWKEHRGLKTNFDACDLDPETKEPRCADQKADRFLGIEANVRVKYEIFKDFNLFGDFAVFLPGDYYEDVTGTLLPGTSFTDLDRVDSTGFDSTNYGLDNHTAFYVNVGVTFDF